MKSVLLTASVAVLMLATLAPVQGATILTFRDKEGAVLPEAAGVPQGYGDRVAATVQGDFSYGQEGPDLTPNIETTYTQQEGGDLSPYGPGYGDLATAIYSSFNYSITFTAFDGFLVNVDSLDIAAFEPDRTISISITNDTGATFTLSDIPAPRAGRTSISFAGRPEALGQFVTIAFGVPDFNVGVSNIQFSQVPEPASALMLAGGLALVGMVRHRRS
jgi:hypothetical protein